ncbi:unnamed protein product [Cladocopium goreaui]|uniref:Uncharacterized protein n=1 Tax=Cladocopium goreaui TaxID=2562237 RepID=A0A9P1GP98_9DINO|nr:unnamed protein product [Cladocopium goreaui]
MADEAQATRRAFTIQGPQVALAMLRGSKRITWPDAPEEASLSKSCVVGMVRDAREAEGSNRLWDSLWPTAEDEGPAAKRQKLTQPPWKSKKRKRRSDAGNTGSPAQVSFTASKRRRLLLRSPLQKPKLAKAPASEALQDVGAADNTDGKVTQLQPRGGLFAFRDDQPVFILSVRTSRKIPLADVVPLKQATFQGRTVLKAKYTETRTCRWSELKDVGLHFQIANCANDRRGASLPFQKQPGETQGDQGRALRENAALAARWQAGNAELGLATSCTVDHSVRSVVPVRLRAHLAERAASGITHHAAPRADESRSFWIPRLN